MDRIKRILSVSLAMVTSLTAFNGISLPLQQQMHRQFWAHMQRNSQVIRMDWLTNSLQRQMLMGMVHYLQDIIKKEKIDQITIYMMLLQKTNIIIGIIIEIKIIIKKTTMNKIIVVILIMNKIIKFPIQNKQTQITLQNIKIKIILIVMAISID